MSEFRLAVLPELSDLLSPPLPLPLPNTLPLWFRVQGRLAVPHFKVLRRSFHKELRQLISNISNGTDQQDKENRLRLCRCAESGERSAVELSQAREIQEKAAETHVSRRAINVTFEAEALFWGAFQDSWWYKSPPLVLKGKDVLR